MQHWMDAFFRNAPETFHFLHSQTNKGFRVKGSTIGSIMSRGRYYMVHKNAVSTNK